MIRPEKLFFFSSTLWYEENAYCSRAYVNEWKKEWYEQKWITWSKKKKKLNLATLFVETKVDDWHIRQWFTIFLSTLGRKNNQIPRCYIYILFINACFITKNRKNKRATNRNKEEECVHIFIYGRLKNLHIVYRHAFLNQDTAYRTLLAFLTARAATHKNTRHKTKIYKVAFQENRCVSHKQVKYQN